MVDMTHDKREHDDAAFVDAYERRLAGGRSEDVPALWRDEIEQMVVIHERLVALPLPEVSPAVRSAVLTAAAQAAAERPQSLWSKVAEFLLRPGPILATAAALALLVAVGQRQAKAPVDAGVGAGVGGGVGGGVGAGAVAMAERPVAAELAPLAKEPVLNQEAAASGAAAVVAQAQVPPAAAAPAPVRDPGPQAASDGPQAVAKADTQRPTRTIAAQPASLAPDTPRLQEKESQPAAPAQVAQGEAASDDQRKLPLAPVMGMARAENNRAQNLDVLNKNQFAQAPAGAAKQAPEQLADAADKKGNDFDKAASKDAQAAVAQSEVQQLRAAVEKTTDPAKKKTLLMKLRGAALQAGDGKTAQWAEQALAANAQNGDASAGGVPSKAKAAPAKSAAPASEKTSY